MKTTFDAGDRITRQPEFLAWAREQGIEPNDTYRMVVNGDVATVYQYERNAEGRFYALDNGDVARRAPFVVSLTSQPPVS